MSHEQLKQYHEESKKNKEDVIFLQVGGFYQSYHFPDGVGSGKIVEEKLRLKGMFQRKAEWSITNPVSYGFPVSGLQKYMNMLIDMKYAVIIYDQDERDKTKRLFKGKFTENMRMDFGLMDSFDMDAKIFSLRVEKYPIYRRSRMMEYKLHYSVFESSSYKLFFGELRDDSVLVLLRKFFIQNKPREYILHWSEDFSEQEILCIKEIIKEQFSNIIGKFIYNTPTMDEMDFEFERSFMKIPENFDYYPKMKESVYSLIQHVRDHLPTVGRYFHVDENPWLSSQSNPNLCFNDDVFQELFLFNVSEDRQKNCHNVTSMFDMLSKNMNTSGKRTLYRKLNFPMTNVDSIRKSLNQIDEIDIPLDVFQNVIDLEAYFSKWQRFLLKQSDIARLLSHYDDLSVHYPELKDVLVTVNSLWDMDEFNHNGENFFKSTTEDYQMRKQKCQETIDRLHHHHDVDINLKYQDDIISSYFQITNIKWNKWSTEKKNKYRIISNNTRDKKIILKSIEETFPSVSYDLEKAREYEKEKFRSDSKIIFEKHSDVLFAFHKRFGEDSMYRSLQKFFRKNSYTKPIVREESNFHLNLDNVRHGLIENLFDDEPYTAFSCNISPENRGKLIFGVNASGKSSYMKSICLAIWLAQCGLYVPADSMAFTPAETLFSKFRHMDNLFRKHSTFTTEIVEINHILERASRKGIVFLDEFPCGTELYSGPAILMGLVNHFEQDKIPFMVSTHIPFLADFVESKFPNIELLHFSVKLEKDQLDELMIVTSPNGLYTRKMESGRGETHYGLEIAQKLKLNPHVIENAFEFRNHIQLEYHVPSSKKSSYNRNLSVQSCQICKSRVNLHTHHVLSQKYIKENEGKLGGYKKNAKYNLRVLCEKCHDKTHHPS